MAKYYFPSHQAEMIDPAVIDWNIRFNKKDHSKNQIHINVNLSVGSGSILNVELLNIPIKSFSFDEAGLSKVIDQHLRENFLIE